MTIDETINKAKHGLITKCLISNEVKLRDRWINLQKYPITEIFIESFYKYSHGVKKECVGEYMKLYG